MIWTADRIVYKGRARRGMGLDVANSGRIRKLAPLDTLASPDHRLEGQAIVLGRIDPYHHSLGLLHRLVGAKLMQAAPVGWGESDTVWDTYAHLLTPQDLYIVARAAFLAAMAQGITCIGEVLSLRYTPSGETYPEGDTMDDAIVRAAQDVGIRLTVIDNVRLRHPAPDVAPQPKCQSAPNLESAFEAFDGLVSRILARHDARLAWALGAHSLDSVPYDSLVAMRVRLGHMPLFLPQPGDAGAQARALRRYGQDPFVTLARRDVLDACMTIVTTTGLPHACAKAVAQSGTNICLSYAPTGPMVQTPHRFMQRSGGLWVPCVATGSAEPSGLARAFADWPVMPRIQGQGTLETHLQLGTAFEKTQKVAAAALGVDAGDLGPGHWADFTSVALPEPLTRQDATPEHVTSVDEEALWAADAIVRALAAPDSGSAQGDVVVGGARVVTGGHHPLQAQSDAALCALVVRLQQSN